jgi:hypothetical protein
MFYNTDVVVSRLIVRLLNHFVAFDIYCGRRPPPNVCLEEEDKKEGSKGREDAEAAWV